MFKHFGIALSLFTATLWASHDTKVDVQIKTHPSGYHRDVIDPDYEQKVLVEFKKDFELAVKAGLYGYLKVSKKYYLQDSADSLLEKHPEKRHSASSSERPASAKEQKKIDKRRLKDFADKLQKALVAEFDSNGKPVAKTVSIDAYYSHKSELNVFLIVDQAVKTAIALKVKEEVPTEWPF